VLCFESDPLRPPKGSLGKLYTVKDGYVAGIINKNVDAGIRRAEAPVESHTLLGPAGHCAHGR
jgi:hypothetical protein